MSDSVLFKHVLPGREPGKEQWLKLLEDRAECVEYAMRTAPLVELGQYKFLASGMGHGQLTDLNGRQPEEVDGSHGLSLATPGIFMTASLRDKKAKPKKWPKGTYSNLIGFTRHGSWIEVRIVEETVKSVMLIRSVEIGITSPGHIVEKYDVSLRFLLEFLTVEFKKWAEEARKRHEFLWGMSERFEDEDRILQAMCEKLAKR